MRQNDERVTVNLEPHLLPLWRRVKGGLAGDTPHARLEAFQRYAHEHEGEDMAAMQAEADAKLERMLAAQRPEHVKRTRLRAAQKAVETRRKRGVGKAL